MGITSHCGIAIRDMTSLVVCISGRMASGKSTISKSLAAALGWRHVGFGEYLRSQLVLNGQDLESRKALQELGERLLQADPRAFVMNVLHSIKYTPGDCLIVDGVRHARIFRIIEALVLPATSKLIFISLEDVTRRRRIALRGIDEGERVRAENHSVEAEVGTFGCVS